MPRQHRPETGYKTVQANGIEFAYFEEGEGPLALLLHGFPDTAHTWDDVRPALAKAGYRAVSPFLRGYAPSGIPAKDTDYRTLAEDALALIEALGHDKATLIGHDWGALAVISAAGMAPEKVERLVHVAIPHPAGIKPTLKLAWSTRHFAALRFPGAVARFAADDYAGVDRLYQRWSPGWDYPQEEVEPTKNAFSAPESCNAAIGYYRKISPILPDFLKRKLPMPTLAVAGTTDPGVTVEDFEKAATRYKGPYQVAAIPGGHFCHRESPEAFLDALLPFLDVSSSNKV